MNAQRKPRVAVVFGGRSSEHAVSCITAGSVLQAIDREMYDVVPIGITAQGKWVPAPDDSARLAIIEGRLPAVEDVPGEVALSSGRELVLQEPGAVPRSLGVIDVVLPLLHGPYGEDGTLQGLLEMADVRYVGSGVMASAVGMDKHYMKLVLAGQGLPVCRYVVVDSSEWKHDPAAVVDAIESLHWPVFVKPARGGSSIGISKVSRPEELATAIALAQEHDRKVLVEEFVPGREIECAVLEGDNGSPPDTSVLGEIQVDSAHEFYDFEAKYLPDQNTVLDIPAGLDERTAAEIQRLAARAFTVLSCDSLARVDFFLRHDGSIVVNEVNTMPGFTPTSMFPLLWAASGIPYPALVSRLLRTALARPAGLR